MVEKPFYYSPSIVGPRKINTLPDPQRMERKKLVLPQWI